MTLSSVPISGSASSNTYTILDVVTLEQRRIGADAVRHEFEEQGVVVFPGFLGQSQLARLRRSVNDHFASLGDKAMDKLSSRRKGEENFATDVIAWNPLETEDLAFQELHRDPHLMQVTEDVLGPGFTDQDCLVMFSVAGGRGQAWHQDCPVELSVQFNLNRLFYTDDVALNDGAIVVVPGSHRLGRIPPGGHQDPISGEVALTPTAGTLIFLHGHVYHRVTHNLSDRPRISVNFRAFSAGTSPDVTCIGVYRNGTVNFCDKSRSHDGTPAPDDPSQADGARPASMNG